MQEREEVIVFFFLLNAAWVRSRAERPSVSYTKVVNGSRREEVIVNASGRGYWVYTCNERPQGRFQ